MTSRPSNTSSRYQSRWRRIGLAAIALSGFMAAGSVWSDILHDTAVHLVALFNGDLPETVSASTPLLVCAVYWAVFSMSLLTALYMAVLDIRFIRVRYALERRELLRQSLGDGLSASLMDKDRGE